MPKPSSSASSRLARPAKPAPQILPFTVYWHRAGNTLAGIQLALQAARVQDIAGRSLQHGIECDLKWADDGGTPLLYLHHGLTGLERLSAETVRKRALRTELLLLAEALDLPGARELEWMVELKRGHGAQSTAVRACAELFYRYGAAERLLFASSSLAVIGDIQWAVPEVKTGLFVGWTFRDGRVLHVPKLQIRRALRYGSVLDPSELTHVDLLIPTNPLSAGRLSARPQAPIAKSWRQLEGFAAAGYAGAFAYFAPH